METAPLLKLLKKKYLGQVDGIFHNGDSELKSDDPVWEGIHVVQGNMDFYDGYPERLVTQLGPTRDHPDPWASLPDQF